MYLPLGSACHEIDGNERCGESDDVTGDASRSSKRRTESSCPLQRRVRDHGTSHGRNCEKEKHPQYGKARVSHRKMVNARGGQETVTAISSEAQLRIQYREHTGQCPFADTFKPT